MRQAASVGAALLCGAALTSLAATGLQVDDRFRPALIGAVLLSGALAVWAAFGSSSIGAVITRIMTSVTGNRITSADQTTVNSNNRVIGGDVSDRRQFSFLTFNLWGRGPVKDRRDVVERSANPAPLTPNVRIELDTIQDNVPLGTEKRIEFYLIQAWFRNVDPVHVVRQVSAEITVRDRQGLQRGQGFARWAIGTKPENVGSWTKVAPKVDFEPRAEAPSKLNAMFRLLGAADCHIYDGQSGIERFHEPEYAVTIHLSGIEFDREFYFRLLNTNETFALLPKG